MPGFFDADCKLEKNPEGFAATWLVLGFAAFCTLFDAAGLLSAVETEGRLLNIPVTFTDPGARDTEVVVAGIAFLCGGTVFFSPSFGRLVTSTGSGGALLVGRGLKGPFSLAEASLPSCDKSAFFFARAAALSRTF